MTDIAAKPVERRVVRVDGVPIKSQARLSDILTVSWLTPQMDRLFIEGASNRRRFLDRWFMPSMRSMRAGSTRTPMRCGSVAVF